MVSSARRVAFRGHGRRFRRSSRRSQRRGASRPRGDARCTCADGLVRDEHIVRPAKVPTTRNSTIVTSGERISRREIRSKVRSFPRSFPSFCARAPLPRLPSVTRILLITNKPANVANRSGTTLRSHARPRRISKLGYAWDKLRRISNINVARRRVLV